MMTFFDGGKARGGWILCSGKSEASKSEKKKVGFVAERRHVAGKLKMLHVLEATEFHVFCFHCVFDLKINNYKL